MSTQKVHPLQKVFGVSNEPVLSYTRRKTVDDKFAFELDGTKHIVIYGGTKQGKTALLQEFLQEFDTTIEFTAHSKKFLRITIGLSETTTLVNIFLSMLQKLAVEIQETKSAFVAEQTSTSWLARIGTDLFPAVPIKAGAEAKQARQHRKEGTANYRTIPFDFSEPEHICTIIKFVGLPRNVFFVLDGYHKLGESVKKRVSDALRVFEDKSIRFIIIGIWEDQNYLAVYNSELGGRIAEIKVEPWLESDLRAVIATGAEKLNIEFLPGLADKIIAAAKGSIAGVQELCKNICLCSGINETVSGPRRQLDVNGKFDEALKTVIENYKTQYERQLELIAKPGRIRLYFTHYYIVQAILRSPIQSIRHGLSFQKLKEFFTGALSSDQSQLPANPDNLLDTALKKIDAHQKKCGLTQPLLKYDVGLKKLRVTDPLLMFFLENTDRKNLAKRIRRGDDDELDENETS